MSKQTFTLGTPSTWDIDQFVRVLRRDAYGADNAIPNGLLAVRLNYPDLGTNGREGVTGSKSISDLVYHARLAGYPVCTGQRGIFMAKTQEEIDKCVLKEGAAAQKHRDRVGALIGAKLEKGVDASV